MTLFRLIIFALCSLKKIVEPNPMAKYANSNSAQHIIVLKISEGNCRFPKSGKAHAAECNAF